VYRKHIDSCKKKTKDYTKSMDYNYLYLNASLLLVMKNSTFTLLTDCFAFAQLSSDIYATIQQNLAHFSSPDCLV
jgi:hypothetical protein